MVDVDFTFHEFWSTDELACTGLVLNKYSNINVLPSWIFKNVVANATMSLKQYCDKLGTLSYQIYPDNLFTNMYV